MASFSNAGTQRGNEGQGHKPENAGGELPPAFSWPAVREQLERGAIFPILQGFEAWAWRIYVHQRRSLLGIERSTRLLKRLRVRLGLAPL